METCSACGHRFDTLENGHAGISLVYGPGKLGDNYRRLILCPQHRDDLRRWIAP